MDFQEKILYHQIHPLKLAGDILSALIGLVFLWQQQLAAALAVIVIVPPAASLAVFCLFDLEKYKDSEIGKKMKKRMNVRIEAARLLGFAISAIGAWYHDALWIAFGLIFVAACWLYVLRASAQDGAR